MTYLVPANKRGSPALGAGFLTQKTVKEADMLWSYVQLDDGTQFAYSETREDGTVRVAVERAVDFGFDHAECFLPAIKWFNVEGFSTDDLDFLTEFVRSNAPFIFEFAERQKTEQKPLTMISQRSTAERQSSHDYPC